MTSDRIAKEDYVDAAVAGIVDAAPGTLDTLNELAAALGDDANFAATTAASLATKVPNTRTVNGHALSSDVTVTKGDVGLGNVDNTADSAKAFSGAQITSGTVPEARIDSALARDSEVAAGYQPLDSDLTDFATLTPTNDDFVQRKSGVWVSRSMAQLKTDLVLVKGDVGLGNVDNTADASKTFAGSQITTGTVAEARIDSAIARDSEVAAGYQPLDGHLTTIAGLTATTDNVIQSVAGVWASRTPAQLKATLALAQADVAGLTTADTPTLAGLAVTGPINEAQGTDIASAATTDIGAATGNFVRVTGTVTITALGTAPAGTRRTVQFNGALTLTHNATSLNLPGSANITTVGGDVATFISTGSGNWKCVSFQKKTWTGTGSQVLGTEGNWTPTLEGSTTAGTIGGGSGWAYNTQAGIYTLISRVCFFTCRLALTKKATDAVGNVRMMGLPFTVKNTNGNSNSVSVNLDTLTTAIVGAQGRAEINSTYCQFYIRTAAAASGTLMVVGDISDTTVIHAGGFYVIA